MSYQVKSVVASTSEVARRLQIVDLTDKQLKAWVKSPPEKKTYIREAQGFTVRRMPGGSVTFLHVYTITGKRKELILGHYPQTSLIDARKRHRESMSSLDAGIDPQGPPPEKNEVLTVRKLIAIYLEQYCANNKTERTTKENKRILEKYILPIIGSRPALDIRRRDAVKLIDDLATKTPGTARGVMKNARAMFTWAMDRELVDINPFAGISRSVQSVRPVHRERTLTDAEIQTMWASFTNPKNKSQSESTRRALMLILTTGVRPGEAANLLSTEIQQGEGKPFCKTCRRCGWWTIPPEKSKNEKEHTVFLTSLAKEIIGEPLNTKFADPVFPGPKMVSIGVVALSHYVRKNKVISGWRPHDLRRTCATGLSRLGCPDEIIDAILNHTKAGVIRVYNRNKYLDEKQEWLQKWSDFLQQLVN